MKPRHFFPALLCVLLIAYPLSMGPAAKWYLRNHAPDSRVPHSAEVLYGPVFWACDHCDAIGQALTWYLGLWIGHK